MALIGLLVSVRENGGEPDPAALRIAEQLEQRLRRNPIKLVAADITTMPPAANDEESEARDEF